MDDYIQPRIFPILELSLCSRGCIPAPDCLDEAQTWICASMPTIHRLYLGHADRHAGAGSVTLRTSFV